VEEGPVFFRTATILKKRVWKPRASGSNQFSGPGPRPLVDESFRIFRPTSPSGSIPATVYSVFVTGEHDRSQPGPSCADPEPCYGHARHKRVEEELNFGKLAAPAPPSRDTELQACFTYAGCRPTPRKLNLVAQTIPRKTNASPGAGPKLTLFSQPVPNRPPAKGSHEGAARAAIANAENNHQARMFDRLLC